MILRNFGIRHGRKALAAPVSRSCLPRTLSTDNTSTNLPPHPSELSQQSSPPLSTEAATEQQPSPSSPTGPPPGAQPWRWDDKGNLITDPVAAAAASAASPSSSSIPGKPQEPPQQFWSANRIKPLDHSIAQNYRTFQKKQKEIGGLGSEVHRRYVPNMLVLNPPRPQDVTLELLMASQAHMGHHTSRWNPANQRYIYGVRAGIHIISLEETAAHLRRAARVVEEVAFRGGLILFVGSRKGQMEIVTRAADLAGACHLFSKWIPGTITNRDQILAGEQIRIVDEKDQDLEGFSEHINERRPLMPDLVVCLNPLENFVLLHECSQENIPTIGVIDTDADPTKVTYTIPANDDSLRSIGVIAGALGRAGEAGQKRRKEAAKEGVVTWRNPAEVAKWMSESARNRSNELLKKIEAQQARENEDAETAGQDLGRQM